MATNTKHNQPVIISKLTEKNIGDWVEYTTALGYPKKGRIKSWNDCYVFVVYKCDNNWSRFANYIGCATNPEGLHFC